MILRISAFISLAASIASGNVVNPQGKISPSSEAGQRLLSKSRALNEERDMTWVANYDIKYTGCSSLVQVRQEGGDGGEGEGLLYTKNLAKFSLCPSDDQCGSCENGADYVVNMMDFLDAYTEYKLNEQEKICENIRANCYCNDDDEDACANQCYENEGMGDCIQYEDEEEFEIQRYLECAEMDGGNNNNNNNGNNYYYNGGNQDNWYMDYLDYFIGPYCSPEDGFSIHLGVFYDQGCTHLADPSVYAKKHYNTTLPYSSESLVESECISCVQVDENDNGNYKYYVNVSNYYNGNNNNYYNGNYNRNNNNNNGNNGNNNNNQQVEVNELCQGVYEQSVKCEYNLESQYRDSSGCKYIDQILPNLEEAAVKAVEAEASAARHARIVQVENTFFKVLTVLFCFTTVLCAICAIYLYYKLSDSKVDLSSS